MQTSSFAHACMKSPSITNGSKRGRLLYIYNVCMIRRFRMMMRQYMVHWVFAALVGNVCRGEDVADRSYARVTRGSDPRPGHHPRQCDAHRHVESVCRDGWTALRHSVVNVCQRCPVLHLSHQYRRLVDRASTRSCRACREPHRSSPRLYIRFCPHYLPWRA